VVGIMGCNARPERDHAALLVGGGRYRAAEDRVLLDRTDCERVALNRRAGFAPAGGRGDGEVLGAVLAGLEGQRVELRRRAAPGPAFTVVAAAVDGAHIVREPGDGDADRAVVGIMGCNRRPERDHAALLVGSGRNRATEDRVLLDRIDCERVALNRRAGLGSAGGRGDGEVLGAVLAGLEGQRVELRRRAVPGSGFTVVVATVERAQIVSQPADGDADRAVIGIMGCNRRPERDHAALLVGGGRHRATEDRVLLDRTDCERVALNRRAGLGSAGGRGDGEVLGAVLAGLEGQRVELRRRAVPGSGFTVVVATVERAQIVSQPADGDADRAVIGIMGCNRRPERDHAALLVGGGRHRATEDRVLLDRTDCERVALNRRAGLGSAGGRGDGEVLGAVLAGLEGQRVELRRRAVPGSGFTVVVATVERAQIVSQPADGDADRAVVGIMGRNARPERNHATLLVGRGRHRAAEDRVLLDRTDCERVALNRRAGLGPTGGRGDGEVLGAVLAGLEGQRVELRRRAVPGSGFTVVVATVEGAQIVRQPGDGDADRAVVGIMGCNRRPERDHVALLVGGGRNRAAEDRVLLDRTDCERVALNRRAGFGPASGRGDGEVLDAVLAGLEGQRVELCRRAAPGSGFTVVAA